MPNTDPYNRGYFVDKALNSNPQLQSSPALTADVANSTDPTTAAYTLAHSANTISAQGAVNDHITENASAPLWAKALGTVVIKPLEWLNKPLKEIQKDYKFIHSMYARGNIFQGMAATLLVAGGATLGFVTGGPMGAVVGADLAAAGGRNLLGRPFAKQAYLDSENENYKVSFGRDLANLIRLDDTDHGLGKIVSGAADAAFDVGVDPVRIGMSAKVLVKQGKWLTQVDGKLIPKIPLAAKVPSVMNFLERNSLRVFSPDQMDQVYRIGTGQVAASLGDQIVGTGRSYVRALDDIASMSAGDIVAKYPELQSMANILGQETTREGVHGVLMTSMTGADVVNRFSSGQALLPSRTVLRAALSKASDKLRQMTPEDELATAATAKYSRANQTNFFIPRRGISTEDAAKAPWILPVAFRPFSKDAWASAIAGKTRTFSGYVPYTIDEGTLNLSAKTFDPTDPNALVGIYRVFRFSLGEQASRDLVSAYAQASTVASKKAIYLGGLHEMLKAAGLPDDAKMVTRLVDDMGTKFGDSVGGQTFGHGFLNGDDVSIAFTKDGDAAAQGLWDHNAGRFSFPDFREVKKAMRSMGAVGKLYGEVDEFAAKHYTDNIFKPFALLTAGFGLRIAASEILPAIFRFGSLETVKSNIASSAAKLNYKLAAGEDDQILANALAAVSAGGDLKTFLAETAQAAPGNTIRKSIARGLTKTVSEQDMELASAIAMATRGHMVIGASLTGHGTDLDAAERARNIIELLSQRSGRLLKREGDKFTQYVSSDPLFNMQYTTQLQKASQNTAQQLIARDLKEAVDAGLSPEDAIALASEKETARIMGVEYLGKGQFGRELEEDVYAKSRKVLAGFQNEKPEAFASRRVDAMAGLLYNHDGTYFNHAFANKINAGAKFSLEEVENLEAQYLPRSVAGRELEAYIGPNLINRISQVGFTKVIDPIINNLSRKPLFFLHVKEEMKSLQYAIDSKMLDYDQALRLAMTRATHAILPQIHNTALRTQFGILVRNYLPFYFAQEQAMRRAGKLILEAPNALRQYQLVEHALNDPGFIESDDQGSRYLVFPLIGELGASAISGMKALGIPVVGGLPVTIAGNMQSLQTVLPEVVMPGVSPFVSVAGNWLASVDPVMSRAVQTVIGDRAFGNSFLDQVVPSSPLRSLIRSTGVLENDRMFQNAMLSAIAAAKYHDQLPGPDASPLEKQEFLDRIKNNARSIFFIKAMMSLWSPLSPQVTQEDQGLRDEFYKLQKAMGNYPEALQEFLYRHGSKAISYTVSRTEGAIKGAYLPYTTEAIDWIESNQELLKSPYATGAAFLVPQATGTGDVQAIHDELIKMHLRSRRTPEEFMSAIYVAAGNNAIAEARTAHNDALAQLSNDAAATDAEKKNWSAWIKQFGQFNPIWWDEYSSTEKRHLANKALSDLMTIYANGMAPDTEQSRLVYGLLGEYNTHLQALSTLQQSGYNDGSITAEKDNWQAYLDRKKASDPRLATIINSVFSRLD